MLISLGIWVYVLSPYTEWACVKGKNPLGCKHHMTVWTLNEAYPDSVAYSVQALLVITALTNFASVILGAARVYKEIAVALDAVTFVFSVIPWALVIGMLDKSAHTLGVAVWVAVGGSFVAMIAACLGLVAIFMPESERLGRKAQWHSAVGDEESKEQLLAPPKPDDRADPFLALMDLFAYVAVVASVGSLFGLYQSNHSGLALSAQGCMIAVALLAFDVAVLTTCIHRKLIDIGMGAIVAASLSLVGWITGIPGCVFTTLSLGSFEFASTCSLISLLSSVVVFGTGIYVGTRFRGSTVSDDASVQ